MNLSEAKLPVVYLKPGELYIARRPTIVTTVLGSCISVTMFNRRLGIGAICHGLLPRCRDKKKCDDNCTEEFKYVGCSVRSMVEEFIMSGSKRNEIEVKVFGGADVFALKGVDRKSANIGKQNIKAALSVIRSEGLHLLTSDVGGVAGRKIFFNTQTGEVFLKRLKRIND
jgi:chemotaxis protein CheD